MIKSISQSLKDKFQRKQRKLQEGKIPDEDTIIELYGKYALEPAEPNMPKPIIPKVGHYTSRLINKQPKFITVRLYGLDTSKSIKMGSTNGLNDNYNLSTHSELEVTDPNDIAFFIRKAIKNNELYEIIKPATLVDDYIESLKPKKGKGKGKK